MLAARIRVLLLFLIPVSLVAALPRLWPLACPCVWLTVPCCSLGKGEEGEEEDTSPDLSSRKEKRRRRKGRRADPTGQPRTDQGPGARGARWRRPQQLPATKTEAAVGADFREPKKKKRMLESEK